jgi:hypothetical protein
VLDLIDLFEESIDPRQLIFGPRADAKKLTSALKFRFPTLHLNFSLVSQQLQPHQHSEERIGLAGSVWMASL